MWYLRRIYFLKKLILTFSHTFPFLKNAFLKRILRGTLISDGYGSFNISRASKYSVQIFLALIYACKSETKLCENT